MTDPYMYIWEFIVVPDHVRAFEQTFGIDGEWVQLFRRAPGYLRTELHRDRTNPQRYITMDYWESQAAWEAFRIRFREAFDALDTKAAQWTRSEREIGRFRPVEREC
jgi:quinol monooxygenase YgiN